MNFVNREMQEALKNLRETDTPQNRNKVLELLITTQLFVPATWDKSPQLDEHGNMTFPPDTHFSILTIQTTDKQRFFPFFTSKEESEKWAGSKNGKMLLLTFDQYIPIVEMAQKDIAGIVVDPYGINTPFQTPFLLGLKDHPRHTGLKETQILKGEKVSLRTPKNVDDLKEILIKYGKEHANVRSIYFKERIVEDKPTHWFIVVDLEEEDPRYLQEMAHYCARCSHGKQFEFMFASMKLSQEIMEKNTPIYLKTDA